MINSLAVANATDDSSSVYVCGTFTYLNVTGTSVMPVSYVGQSPSSIHSACP